MLSKNAIIQIPTHRITSWVYILITMLLTYVAFGNLSEHKFNAIGDDQETLNDLQLISEDISNLFSSSRQSPIRPTMDLPLLAAYQVWQRDPKGYHILLVGLHAMAALLLTVVFRQLGADIELKGVAGLFFLLNVAHFRTIQWLVCIGYIIAFIFALLCLITYFKAQTSGKKTWTIACSLMLCAGIWSHPSAAAIMPFCAYLTYHQSASVRQTLTATGPLLVATGLSVVAIYLFSPHVNEVTGLLNQPDPIRLLLNPLWYLSRLITSAHWLTPAGIGNEYHPWEIVLGLVACLGTLMLYRHRLRPAADGAVWAIISVLPFLNNALDRLTVGPSRQLYMASAGSALVLAWALRALLCNFISQKNIRQIAWVILLIGICTCSIWHLKRAEAIDFWLIGRSHIAANQYDAGTTQYKKAVALAPDLITNDTYYSWVPLLLAQGKSPEKILQNALAHTPDSADLHFLMGISAFLQNDPEIHKQGEATMGKALHTTTAPDKMLYGGSLAFHNLAVYYKKEGRYADAAQRLKKALLLRPQYPLASFLLGEVLYEMGNTQEANNHFHQAISQDSSYLSKFETFKKKQNQVPIEN